MTTNSTLPVHIHLGHFQTFYSLQFTSAIHGFKFICTDTKLKLVFENAASFVFVHWGREHSAENHANTKWCRVLHRARRFTHHTLFHQALVKWIFLFRKGITRSNCIFDIPTFSRVSQWIISVGSEAQSQISHTSWGALLTGTKATCHHLNSPSDLWPLFLGKKIIIPPFLLIFYLNVPLHAQIFRSSRVVQVQSLVAFKYRLILVYI